MLESEPSDPIEMRVWYVSDDEMVCQERSGNSGVGSQGVAVIATIGRGGGGGGGGGGRPIALIRR